MNNDTSTQANCEYQLDTLNSLNSKRTELIQNLQEFYQELNDTIPQIQMPQTKEKRNVLLISEIAQSIIGIISSIRTLRNSHHIRKLQNSIHSHKLNHIEGLDYHRKHSKLVKTGMKLLLGKINKNHEDFKQIESHLDQLKVDTLGIHIATT